MFVIQKMQGERKMSNEKLSVSPAPHVTNRINAVTMMIAMIIAMLPSVVLGVINFKVKALILILISVASSFVFDVLFRLATKKKVFFYDLSSLVTGLMTALVLPVTVPYWLPVVASFIATVVFKGCFGGLGRNLFNPTAGARVVLAFVMTGLSLSLFKGTAGTAVLSPLEYFSMGDYSSITIRSMFFGTAPGAIGTVCVFAIIISGVLLMSFRITDYVMPCMAMISFVVTTWIGKGAIAIIPFMFSGSFMFATMFMLPDPTTSPSSVWGRFIYGLLFGLFAGLFRVTNVLGETSVFVAILMVNLLSPMLDKIFAPRPFCVKRKV